MATVVPTKHRAAFITHMRDQEARDAEQWAMLDAAEEFLILKRLERGSPFDALRQYHALSQQQQSAETE